MLAGGSRPSAGERGDLVPAAVGPLRAAEKAVPAGVLIRDTGRADGGYAAEPRLPADQIGAMPAELVSGRDERGREQVLVGQVEGFPHGIGADHDRRPHLAHEVGRIDGDGTPYPPPVDDDLDRLPAERDLAAPCPDRARPGLHQALHAAHLVIVGDEGPLALRIPEELHQPADRGLLGMPVEDDRRHEEEGAADAGVSDVAREPRAEGLGELSLLLGGSRTRELTNDLAELGHAVRGTLEEVARRGEEALRPPPAALEHAVFREAVQAQRLLHPAELHLDAGFTGRLRAVVPRELAVADVVAVAMAEVDPVAIGSSDGAAPAADGVGLLEDHDPLALASEDRARHEPGERRADDDDVGLRLARLHWRREARTGVLGCQRSIDSLSDPQL